MSFIYTNKETGERLESNSIQTCDEILALLRKLINPKSTLITKLPSGIGLDIEVQKDGELWIEFYADDVSSAFVTMPIAELVIRRAFTSEDRKIKESFSDLITKWEC